MSVFDDISHNMNKDAEDLQGSIGQLQQSMSGVSSMWQDEKYSELADAIRSLSNDSVDLLKASEQCSAAIQRIGVLAAERY